MSKTNFFQNLREGYGIGKHQVPSLPGSDYS